MKAGRKPKSQLHPSILAQPNIQQEKVKSRKLRDKEREEIGIEMTEEPENNLVADPTQITEDTSILPKVLNPALSEKEKPDDTRKRPPRKIQLFKDQKEYDVLEDLNNTKCDITYGQLLNVAPK